MELLKITGTMRFSLRKSKKKIKIKKQPWFPDSVLDMLDEEPKKRKIIFNFSKNEKKALKKEKRIKISEWAEKYRYVRVSSRAGLWKNSVTPYLKGIMDAVGESFVHEITVCATPQVGKTELGYNCLASWIDQDPGPALMVLADEQTAKDEITERIIPMIEDSPKLKTYKTERMRDLANSKIVMKNGMVIHAAWATSVSRLATKPKRYVIFDEIDKYPQALKKETDPISLGKKRTRTYPDEKKIIKISTPTWEYGPIWQAWNEAQARFIYLVKCPDCNCLQEMIFGEKNKKGGIKFPAEIRDPFEIENKKLARYQCIDCGSMWDDRKRDSAVAKGIWFCEGKKLSLEQTLHKKKYSNIAFHIPAWLSSFVSLSECVEAFLKGQNNKVLLRDFMNAYAAKPWIEYEQQRDEDVLLALKDQRTRGMLPEKEKVFCLTAGIDTQDDGFWYEIRAWGYGHAMESWQVREGFIPALWNKVSPEDLVDRKYFYHPAFDPLREILWETEYLSSDGTAYKVRLGGIDAMGHHTTEVYDFCRFHKGKVYPIQGMRNRSNRPFKYSKLDTYPGSNKVMPGGLILLQLDVNHFKDELSGRLQISPIDPGAWHFHSETTISWVQQLCTEYLNDKTGRWECPDNKENHGWDVSVYNIALAEVLGVRILSQQKTKKVVKKKRENTENPFLRGENLWNR